MICKIKRNITHSCGYNLPTISEIYFLNIDDFKGIATDVYDNCEIITGITYDDVFYKVEGTNIQYTDALIVDDYQRYRQKTLEFNLYGENDECRVRDYNVLALGRYVALLKVNGQWILAGFLNGFEADENEISTENNFHIVMTENSIVSSIPVDDALVESIIHHEQRSVKARLYYTNGIEEIVYSNGDSDTTLYANEIPADGSSSKLQRVVIDNIVTDIESGIFSRRSELNSVQLSSGLTEIPDEAFFQCSSLRNIVLPSGVTNIGSFVFGRAALDEIELPNGLLTIGEYAFDTTNLVEITIPSTVTSIGDYVFSSNISLKRIVFTGSTAPTITTNTFGQMANLTEIYVPCGNETYHQGNWEDVDTKEEMTFELYTGSITYTLCGYDYIDYNMVRDFIDSQEIATSAITSVTVGDYVRRIEPYAFDVDLGFDAQEITLGKNVERIEDLAFNSQNNIQAITIYNDTPPVINSVSDLIDTGGTSGDNILIFVPSGSVQTYKEAEGWEDNEEQIFPIGYVQKNYLTFTALEDGVFSMTNNIDYSLDSGNTWATLSKNTNTPTIHSGEKVMWKAQLTPTSAKGIGTFSSTEPYEVEGNIMSLLFGDNFENQTDLTGFNSYVFTGLFSGNTGLMSAENLELPATTLARGCYVNMFNGCTRLTTAPELPATTMAIYSYQGMFRNCTSLTIAPKLSATTLEMGCYTSMFKGCTSLTTAPELPATTLAEACYDSIFMGCTSLTTAPELPATTLAASCYNQMFSNCTSLTTAPELSATTLAINCYSFMFKGCTSLTSAPELPATTLNDYCYSYMFQGCASLNYIKMLATSNLSASNCLRDWVSGVAATGTFVKAASATLPRGTSGIPSGWTVVNA